MFRVCVYQNREGGFHAQRLATLGMLAGGIAHDFNNVLAGILGHITYLKTILPQRGPHTESLHAIEEGGKKASSLTQQILNFSRLNTAEELGPVDLRGLVIRTWRLLRGAISPEYNLEYKVMEDPAHVRAVEGKLAQVIVNLVINARDAVQPGGSVVIRVVPCRDRKKVQRFFGDGAGVKSYVSLVVADDGEGMPREVLARAFEPYFSTKKDKGTGLGLSTVLAIVRGFGGGVDIRSSVGSGTEVEVLLPVVEVGVDETRAEAEDAPQPLQSGTERVLVVDDEDPVRNVLSVSLLHMGYSVDVAASGAEALAKAAAAKEPYDLVILDMLMPNLAGDEVFFRLREIDPEIRVLIISGYSSEESVERILESGGKGFIQKPFTIEELSKRVRDCLDRD